MTVAFYISGHGFGHASQQVEIINAFGLRHPDVGIFVRSAVSFEGYTDGRTKQVVDGYMSSCDMGHFDANGLLFVDGRADEPPSTTSVWPVMNDASSDARKSTAAA